MQPVRFRADRKTLEVKNGLINVSNEKGGDGDDIQNAKRKQ